MVSIRLGTNQPCSRGIDASGDASGARGDAATPPKARRADAGQRGDRGAPRPLPPTARAISLVAHPASGRRSAHPPCARTFAYPPAADGMPLLDPRAGRNAPGSAPLRHCGALGEPLRRPRASGAEEATRGSGRAPPPVGAALPQGGPSAPGGPGARVDVREGRRGRPVGGRRPVVRLVGGAPRSRDARRGRAGGGAAAARAAARRHGIALSMGNPVTRVFRPNHRTLAREFMSEVAVRFASATHLLYTPKLYRGRGAQRRRSILALRPRAQQKKACPASEGTATGVRRFL